MKRLYSSLLCASLALFALTAAQVNTASADGDRPVDKLEYPKLNKLVTPDVDKRTLSNGIEIYMVEDHSLPTFSASVRMKLGSYLEPAEKVGLAGIVGSVMREGGANKWTGDEIDEMLEGVGATVETGIGLTSGSAFANSLIEYSDMSLEVLAELLQNPTFDQDKIDINKTQVKGGISRRNDDAQGVASRIFSAAIYGEESPYVRWEEYETIDAITRDDLVEFHKRWVHPKNLQIAVWGDFSADEMAAKLEKYFGSWVSDGETAPPPPEVEANWDKRVKFVEKSDVNQTNIYIGHLGGKVQDEDYPTRLVMNNVFGGGFGSRLFNSVRSREGLAYATGGGYGANLSHPGRFLGFASTKSETTVKAIKEIIKQMELMKAEPPTDEEVDRAINSYLNSFVFNFDTKSEVVNRMVTYDAYGMPQDFLSQVKDKVEKVTPADVQAAAQKHFQTDKMFITVVGKSEDFDEPLASLSMPIDTVDITIPSGEPESDVQMTDENIAKGRSILAASIEACGGAEKFVSIKNYRKSGDMTMNMGGRSMNLKSRELCVLPGQTQTELTTPMGVISVVFDGSQGWQSMGGQSQQMSESQIQENKSKLARDIFVLFATANSSTYTPVYGGGGEVDGASVEFVHFIDSDGNELMKMAFGAESRLPVSQEHFGETPAGPANVTEQFSDFREVSGLRAPFATTTMANGQTMQEVKILTFELNVDVPAETFTAPGN